MNLREMACVAQGASRTRTTTTKMLLAMGFGLVWMVGSGGTSHAMLCL